MNKHTPTPWGVNAYGEVCQDRGEFYGLRDRVEVTGFLLTESAGNPEAAANTAHIVRCVNSHDALVRIAELVQHAVLNRADRDWTMMHMDLSEAAELAKQVAPLAAAGAPQ
jgi:hypothetical protein